MIHCNGCACSFHRECAKRHALSSVENGAADLKCPVLSCKAAWGKVLDRCLSPVELERYHRHREKLLEFRATRDASLQAGPDEPDAEKKEMLDLGLRRCPGCATWVEKNSMAFYGCDNVTCRCGCRFCFACGLAASADGKLACKCTSTRHGFIDVSDVLDGYNNVFANELWKGFTFASHKSFAHMILYIFYVSLALSMHCGLAETSFGALIKRLIYKFAHMFTLEGWRGCVMLGIVISLGHKCASCIVAMLADRVLSVVASLKRKLFNTSRLAGPDTAWQKPRGSRE